MSLGERFAELNAATSETAKTWAAQGRTARTWHLLGPPLRAFVGTYAGQGGWRRGVDGLTDAVFDAYTVFVAYAKLWERQHGFAVESDEAAASRPCGDRTREKALDQDRYVGK